MKTLIIYQSVHHLNTEKIAKVIAKILNADLLKPDQVKIDQLINYDLIGFGSGIYAWRHHQSLFKLVNKFPHYSNKPTFIFSTSGKGGMNLHQKLKNKLIDKGFRIIDEFSCKGWDSFGPFALIGGLNKGRPNAEDFKNAETFAKNLKI